MSQPYISFIASSRNDDHGGDILKRMKIFVKGLIHQTQKYNLPAELILVEWNPPEDRPLLSEVLPKPGKDALLTIRYIIVPKELHARYSRGDVIPLYQMIAKNVGIRRAKGEFILCTNIDLLFSDELFEVLAKKQLKKDHFYRANRCDIKDELEFEWDFEKQLEFARNNKIRTIGKHRYYPYAGNVRAWVYNVPPLIWAVNFAIMLKRYLLEQRTATLFNNLDTNACGDFTLMSKEAWIEIQGYIELDLYSIHIDTLALIGAASLGYKQYIFPPGSCTYHIDHHTGWEAMSTIERIKFWEERPGVGFDSVWDSAMVMMKEKLKFNLNPEDWGFENMELKEIRFPEKD